MYIYTKKEEKKEFDITALMVEGKKTSRPIKKL